jgi:4-amino-4-deoxy-L-arabinose transferase-like glycosyltransferase
VASPRGIRERALPRGVWLAATGVLAVLVVAAAGYGFHRDELYFQEAGRHPAFGYPDQPPLVPLLAAAADVVSGGSIVLFRLAPALATALTVLVAALTSRELGGTRADMTWTAGVTALASAVVATGHLFSTTTFDLTLTSACVLLLIRALSAPQLLRRWLLLGAVAAVALEVKTLPATVLLCCGVGVLVAGPRRVLLRPGPWLGAAVALAGALPNLLWQQANGWPQLALARAIAGGSSGTSVGRALVVPLQFELTGPVLLVVLVAGLVALLRDAGLRWLGVAYLVLLAFVTVTGGKPYYMLGLVPALLAAGVPPVRGWLGRGGPRRVVAWVLVALHVVITAVLVLPVVPPSALASTPVTDVNYDAGETVGWGAFTATVERAFARVPTDHRAGLVVLTGNYGEAGALDRARRQGADLPAVYSGHNAYGWWGPPPGRGPLLLVGHRTDAEAAELFTGCSLLATVDNGLRLDNDEQGATVRLCDGPVGGSWASIWPRVRHLD